MADADLIEKRTFCAKNIIGEALESANHTSCVCIERSAQEDDGWRIEKRTFCVKNFSNCNCAATQMSRIENARTRDLPLLLLRHTTGTYKYCILYSLREYSPTVNRLL